MRIFNYEAEVHWGNSVACEFVTEQLKIGLYKDKQDMFIKFGGFIVIVSRIVKGGPDNRGVPQVGLGDASPDNAGTDIRSTYG